MSGRSEQPQDLNQKLPLSVVIITKNEAVNIGRCLTSVKWARDIVVLDSGSQDSTLAIAKEMGARTFNEDWRGFGPHKHRAVELAQFDWVLCLDADEIATKELAQELRTRWSELDSKVGYSFPRKSFYLGRWILHGGWYPDRQLRFFNRKHSQWSQDPVHEKVLANQVQPLSAPLEHYVFRDIEQHMAANNRYSGLQAKAWVDSGRDFSWWRFLIKPPVKFVECYVWKLGFLDGFAGFFIAVGAAYSVFIRWGKIWELGRKKS